MTKIITWMTVHSAMIDSVARGMEFGVVMVFIGGEMATPEGGKRRREKEFQALRFSLIWAQVISENSVRVEEVEIMIATCREKL